MSGRKINEFFSPVSSRSAKRLRSSSSPELSAETNSDSRVILTSKMMDNQPVGNMTMGQLVNGLKDSLSQLFDQKLENLATKQDFLVLSDKISNLSKDSDTVITVIRMKLMH
jgi:hypothetical protein